MPSANLHVRCCLATLLLAAGVAAQTPSPGRVPIRTLTMLAASRDSFGAPLNVQALPRSRVLVNDAKLHRLVILDSMMRVERVVLDSAPGRSNSYGSRPEPVIPYGDSALFVNDASRALLLVTPDGEVTRSIAAPNDRNVWTVMANCQGIDPLGRMVYRGLALRDHMDLTVQLVGYNPGGPISNLDSLPLIRADLATRRLDTIAALRNAQARRIVTTADKNGAPVFTSYVNPMVAGDEWALLSDGTIAVVRGHDYHVDWIAPDGTKTSTAKLPFDWKRLSDADKTRVRDSAMVAATRADSAADARLRAAVGANRPDVAVGRGGGDPSSAPPPISLPKRSTIIVPVDSLPDYYPAVRPNAARGDRDGNLWVLPSTSAQSIAGELVYDVVNRKGELLYRVRAPLGRSIAGFAAGGIVFLLDGDITKGFRLERARVAENR
jgi:hypothetical protein